MTQPRKHHYLPQFYLRGFSLDGQSLYQIDKASGKCHGVRIKDTAAIRDFHEIDGDEVDDPHLIEKQLAKVEGALAPYLANLLGGQFQDRATRMAVLQLLAMLRLRVPAVKQHIQRSKSAAVHSHLKLLEKAGKLPTPPAGFEDALRVDKLHVEVMNWNCLEIMFRMSADEKVLQLLYAMRPMLLLCPFGTRFVTSDQPVALFHPRAASAPGIGPATRGVEISLPLSSRTALLLDHQPGAPVERIATSAEVEEINRRTIVMAQDYVFTGEAPEALQSLLAHARGQVAGFRYEQVPTNRGFMHVERFMAVGPR